MYVLSQAMRSVVCVVSGERRFKLDERKDRVEVDEKTLKERPFKPDARRRRKSIDAKAPCRGVESEAQALGLTSLVALGVPQRNPNDQRERFDGKLGRWPTATRGEAKRKSANREAGSVQIYPGELLALVA